MAVDTPASASIDAGRDDDDRRAHGHDGEKAGVGGRLQQRVQIVEVVDGGARLQVDVAAGREREHQAEERDDEHEARLLPRDQAHESGAHRR
jgi:hypothetical protein